MALTSCNRLLQIESTIGAKFLQQSVAFDRVSDLRQVPAIDCYIVPKTAATVQNPFALLQQYIALLQQSVATVCCNSVDSMMAPNSSNRMFLCVCVGGGIDVRVA